MMRVARLLLLVSAACADDNGEVPPADESWPGVLTWSWTFSDGGPCPPDVTVANIYIASWDTDRNFVFRTEPRVITSAPCAGRAGQFPLSNALGVGRRGHETWLELATADGRIYARSPIANSRTEDANPSAVIDVSRGWVHARWTLRGAEGPLACADVPAFAEAGAIELYESVADDIVVQPSLVDCARSEVWVALSPGTYDLTLGAFAGFEYYLGSVGNPRLLGKVALGAQTVTAGATLELGTHELVLAGY